MVGEQLIRLALEQVDGEGINPACHAITAFETAANNAKAGCPVSKVLNARITMDAKLEV